MPTEYDAAFYTRIKKDSRRSAERVVPYIVDLVRPSSIVDVGCGSGEWLRVALELGVADVLGLDGEYARSSLSIPAEHFRATALDRPIDLGRRFDLALSIEVAEHLPEAVAARFVRDLTRLAPLVLFGAAIPGQGGVGHVNEQWLDYWMDLFSSRDYAMVDCVRRRFWDDPDVIFHSAQNLVIFAERGLLQARPDLLAADNPMPLRVVHPELFRISQPKPPSLGLFARQMPEAVTRTWRSQLRRVRGEET